MVMGTVRLMSMIVVIVLHTQVSLWVAILYPVWQLRTNNGTTIAPPRNSLYAPKSYDLKQNRVNFTVSLWPCISDRVFLPVQWNSNKRGFVEYPNPFVRWCWIPYDSTTIRWHKIDSGIVIWFNPLLKFVQNLQTLYWSKENFVCYICVWWNLYRQGRVNEAKGLLNQIGRNSWW